MNNNNPAGIFQLKIILIIIFIITVSCSKRTEPDGKVKVIFDTDIGSDCDDAGAMAVLHKLADAVGIKLLCSLLHGPTISTLKKAP